MGNLPGMEPLLRLTPHLDSRFGTQSGEVVLCNLVYGTRILAQTDSWDKLAPFAVPHPLGNDPWLERARDAFVLVDGQEAPPDCVRRLVEALHRYRPQAQGTPLELLEQAERHFRAHHMPRPYTGPAPQGGPLMNDPSRLVDFMFDHTRALLRHDLSAAHSVDLELVRMFCQRPALKLRYEQQFCTPDTTERRARAIAAAVPPGGRILVLGDDDLVSLALLHYGGDFQLDVLELDTDLVAFLKTQGGERLTVLEHNLRHGVPDSMRQAYDVVTTDPPYAAKGMRFFLQCALDSLRPGPASRLFLTTFPGLLEKVNQVTTDLAELGFVIRNQQDHFSRYVYNNAYRVEHLAALRSLGCPLHPTTELLGFPYLYAHFYECEPSLPA